MTAPKRVFGVPRDCQHQRAQHQHGTWLAYQNDLCSCDLCREAWSKYVKRWTHRTRKGPVKVSAEKTILMLRSLAAIGYSHEALARELQTGESTIRMLFKAERTFPQMAERVARMYSRLCMTPAPEGKSSRQAKRHAALQGWQPPLAYSDDDDWELVDQTPVRRGGRRGPDASWVEEFDFLVSCGESEEQALKQVGKTRHALDQARSRESRRAA